MKTFIVLLAAIGIGYVGWTLWQRAHERKHDPIEYFAGWDGYTLPIRLTGRSRRRRRKRPRRAATPT